MTPYLNLQDGVLILYDGTVVYIDSFQYSHDGLTYWENAPFNPNDHIFTGDGVTPVGGHKYRRTRLAGTTEWGLPEYIVATDGKNLQLRVEGEYIQWAVEGGTTWTNLLLIDSIKGGVGAQGIPGEGMNIDRIVIFDTKGTCATNVPSTNSGCCNGMTYVSGGTSYGTNGIVLSLGNHLLNDTDDTGKYFSNDALTWTLYVSATHKGQTAMYWNASNISGLGAYTVLGTNIVQGSSGGTDTNGYLYTCVDGVWVLIKSIAANDHRLQETSGSTHINYADSYVTDYGTATITGIGTIGMKNGVFEIIDQSITTDKFDTTVFNDGLTNTGTEIDVNVSELNGYGLDIETGLDGKSNLRVLPSAFIGDGLNWKSVGSNEQIYVNSQDLIDTTVDGLVTYTALNGYDNLRVKVYDGLVIDTNGVNTKTDELTLISDTTSIRVKPYVTGNDGISAIHLNPSVGNVNKGLLVNNTTGIEVKVEGSAIGFDGTGQLDIPDNGVQGIHLNDDTCNNMKGIEVLSNQLGLKVDNTTIDFNGSGQLELKNTYLSSRAVTSLSDVTGIPKLVGDVQVTAAVPPSFVTITTDANITGNKIELNATVDNAVLDGVVTGLGYIKSSATSVTNDIGTGNPLSTANWDHTSEIKTYVDQQDNLDVLKDHQYGNMKVKTTGVGTADGLYIQLGSTAIFARLEADNNGNLYLSDSNRY